MAFADRRGGPISAWMARAAKEARRLSPPSSAVPCSQLLDYEEADEEATAADAAKEGAQVGKRAVMASRWCSWPLGPPKGVLASRSQLPGPCWGPAGQEGLRGHPQQRLQGLPAEARAAARHPGLRLRAPVRG